MNAAHERAPTVRYSLGMGKKLSLPIVAEIARSAGATPTVERARQKLGGTGSTDARAGRTVRDDDGVVGVVLFARDEEMDVLVSATGTVRRGKASTWIEHDRLPDELAATVPDVVVFAHLEAGERVGFREPAGTSEGLLFEKCRYGALVARDDRSILAIGFRNLWPIGSDSTPS